MKKLLTLGVVGLLLANLLSAISIASLNPAFFERFYDEQHTYQAMGMSQTDLMKATHGLVDYMIGKRDDLDIEVWVNQEKVAMFNQREIDHMVDVLALYQGMVKVQWASYGFFIIMALLALLKFKKQFFMELLEASKQALVLLAIILGGLSLFAIIDFNQFWTSFHLLFFTNDLWLLDPLTDRMISMVPLLFFQKLVFTIVLYWVLSVFLYFLLVKAASLRSKL